MTAKTLVVDDDANLLSGIKRSLRKIEGIYTSMR